MDIRTIHRLNQIFARRLRLFSWSELEVTANVWLILLLPLLFLTLALRTFPSYYVGLSEVTYWEMATVTLFGFLASLALHEYSHVRVARKCGVRPRGILLDLFGSDVPVEFEELSLGRRLWVKAGGLLTSSLVSVALYALTVFLEANFQPRQLTGVVFHLAVANATIVLVQLLPLLPLDGGQILLALFSRNEKVKSIAATAIYFLGVLIVGGLLLAGAVQISQERPVIGGWICLLSLALYAANRKEMDYLRVRETLKSATVLDFVGRETVSVPGAANLKEFQEGYVKRLPYQIFPVLNADELAGYIDRISLRRVPQRARESEMVWDFTIPASVKNTISPEAPASQALTLMQETGNSRLLVARNARLFGIVTFGDLCRGKRLKAVAGNR